MIYFIDSNLANLGPHLARPMSKQGAAAWLEENPAENFNHSSLFDLWNQYVCN